MADIGNWMKAEQQVSKVGTIGEDIFAKLSVGKGIVTKYAISICCS